MESPAQFILTIGSILLLGLFTSTIARRTFLPRVTLLLIFGVIIGHQGFNLIPHVFAERFDIVADMTLLMVGFLLGEKLTKATLKESGAQILWISLCAALATTSLVHLGLMLFGFSIEISIILGCIAAATAPAAILDVVNESNYKGKFSNLLLSIVAIDDIWALILFAVGISLVKTLNGTNTGDVFFIYVALKEIGGALLLGIVIGLPAAFLTGRVKKGQPILSEALGIVFICGGLALWLDVSYLIASMVMGAVVANLAKHHEYPFHAIKGIESTFMVVFFVLAGVSLELSSLRDLGLISVVYIICRSLGKYLGSHLGSQISHADNLTKHWMGIALLPQAGVAIGMALVASNQFPEYRQILLSTVISSTIFFEIIGPIFTRLAIKKASVKNTP